MGAAWLSFRVVSFGLALPFLALSFANGFYGARWQEALRLAGCAD